MFMKYKVKAKASRHSKAFIKYIENMMIGKVSVSEIRTEVGISPKTMKRIIQRSKDPNTEEAKVLKKNHVKYTVKRMGKTRRAYFIKKEAPLGDGLKGDGLMGNLMTTAKPP
jgi:hypothetical protein